MSFPCGSPIHLAAFAVSHHGNVKRLVFYCDVSARFDLYFVFVWRSFISM